MYNLIIKYHPWGRADDGIPSDRFLKYTDDQILARVRPGGKPDYALLRTLPTLFVQECPADGPELAYFGTVKTFVPDGKRVLIEAAIDPDTSPIPVRLLKKRSLDLGVTDQFDWAHTQWTVKGGDLFHVLYRIATIRRQLPSVFKIGDHVNIDPKLVSVMMPFAAEFDPVYEAIGDACKEAGFLAQRADDIWKNESVMQDVVDLIDGSCAVIADCSGKSANVFYEVGIAHTLGRPVIPISQAKADVPFDVEHLRFAHYHNNGEGLLKLQDVLRKRLGALFS